MVLIPAFVLLIATQAATPPAPPTVSGRRWTRMFISPMGEPFRQSGRDDDTLADWFGGADRNHDGKLTIEEMQADSERFFAALDTNRDGEIDPDEITHYEQVVAPEVISGGSFGLMEGGEPGGRRRKAGFVRSNDTHQGAGRFGLLDLPEPVVSADANFNRGISLAEFRQAATQRFIALDLDHHGYLTLPSLETIRPAPASAPKAPSAPRPSGDESDPG